MVKKKRKRRIINFRRKNNLLADIGAQESFAEYVQYLSPITEDCIDFPLFRPWLWKSEICVDGDCICDWAESYWEQIEELFYECVTDRELIMGALRRRCMPPNMTPELAMERAEKYGFVFTRLCGNMLLMTEEERASISDDCSDEQYTELCDEHDLRWKKVFRGVKTKWERECRKSKKIGSSSILFDAHREKFLNALEQAEAWRRKSQYLDGRGNDFLSFEKFKDSIVLCRWTGLVTEFGFDTIIPTFAVSGSPQCIIEAKQQAEIIDTLRNMKEEKITIECFLEKTREGMRINEFLWEW